MTERKILGGGPLFAKLCRNCKDWETGGWCGLWKKYAFGGSKACGYFTLDNRTDQERRDGVKAV